MRTADGDNVQITAPLDSVLVFQAAGSTSEVDDKESEDKTGVFL